MTPHVRLRAFVEADLPTLFDYQRAPEAMRKAALQARDWDAFVAHTMKNARDETVVLKIILADEEIAGSIVSFEKAGLHLVGYLLGQNHWGKGVATRALEMFLHVVTTRPLHAFVAKQNVGSIRVLEKNGFTFVREEKCAPDEHGVVIDELFLSLGPVEV